MNYIWLIGTSASGKTTFSRLFNKIVLSDADYIWNMARKKTKVEGGWMIEDKKIDCDVRELIITQAMQHTNIVIECAIGSDIRGVRDMSFSSLLAQIDQHSDTMIDDSLFLYFDVPYKTRLERNKNRKDTRILPESVMERLHQTDDFKEVNKKFLNYKVIKNP